MWKIRLKFPATYVTSSGIVYRDIRNGQNKGGFLRISPFIRNWLLHKHDSSRLLGILQYGVGSNRACCGHCTLSITWLFFFFCLFGPRLSCVSRMSAGIEINKKRSMEYWYIACSPVSLGSLLSAFLIFSSWYL